MKRISSLDVAAVAALIASLLGACAALPDGAGTRLDDIVSIPLSRSDPADRGGLSKPSGMALAPSAGAEPERVRREEALRRELGVDHRPDGSWDGCFMRGLGPGC